MLQDKTHSLYHIYSYLRYRAQNWVLTILLSFNKISSLWWADRLAFPQAGLMLLPVVLSLRVTLILSKQLKQAILFFFFPTLCQIYPLIFQPHLGLAASSIRQEGIGRKAACMPPARWTWHFYLLWCPEKSIYTPGWFQWPPWGESFPELSHTPGALTA